MRISDWSSDVCSSDLHAVAEGQLRVVHGVAVGVHGVLLEAERAAQPVDRGQGVAVAQAGDDGAGGGGCVGHGWLLGWTGRCHPMRLPRGRLVDFGIRSEEHTFELQSLMRISYAVFCLKKK